MRTLNSRNTKVMSIVRLEKTLRRRNRRHRKKNKTFEKQKDGVEMEALKRVNHFVAIQVTNGQIREQVKAIQEKMLSYPITPIFFKASNRKKKKRLETSTSTVCEEDEEKTGLANIFRDAMERIDSLHFTVGVVGLYDQEEKDRANKVLEACWKKFRLEIQENPINLNVMGLHHFGGRVIFAKIQDEQHVTRLTSFANDLRTEFEKNSILQAPSPFKAHMTIAKISRSKSLYKKKIKVFPSEIWRDFDSHFFGQQPVNSVQLLAMKMDPATKYYKIVSEFHVNPGLNDDVTNETQNEPETSGKKSC